MSETERKVMYLNEEKRLLAEKSARNEALLNE